jgi:hypothetical protein
MGILCIFGHSYGDVQRSEERNEQGREIVTTIQEYKICARCGKTRILSEFKEASVEPIEEEGQEQKIEDIEMDSELYLEDVVDKNLEDISEETGLELVEEETEEWPEVTGEDEGFSAGLPEASIENIEFGGGLIPKSLREEETEGEEVIEFPEQKEEELKIEKGDGEGGEVIQREPRGRRKDTKTMYVCGQCEYQTPIYESALRKGDICPACKKGYIDERLIEKRFGRDRG